MIKIELSGTVVVAMTYDEVANELAADGSFAHFANPKRRREKQLVNIILHDHFGVERSVVLLNDADGAPFLPGCERCVSVSHSDYEAAVAISDHRIGIDVEHPREALLRVAPRFLSSRELDYYGGSMPLLVRAWTIKEAVYKAMRRKLMTSEDIALSCREPRDGRDFAVADGVTLAVTLIDMPGGALMAVAETADAACRTTQ